MKLVFYCLPAVVMPFFVRCGITPHSLEVTKGLCGISRVNNFLITSIDNQEPMGLVTFVGNIGTTSG